MGLSIATEPDVEPVKLALAKSHLKVDGNAEDELIVQYIGSARKWLEAYTHRALITQSWDLTLDDFPQRRPYKIELPFGKCSAVATIKYYDTDGTLQTLTGPSSGSPAGSDYQEDISSDEGAIIKPPVDGEWPEVQDDRLSPVTVRFDAGYGIAGSSVPADLITGLLYRLTDLFEFRGDVDGGGTQNAKLQVSHLRILRW